MPTIKDSGDKAMIESVKAEHPQSFTVGAHADILAKKGEATVSYDRSWKNGLGLTAYLTGWWNDTAVIPQEKKGVVVGTKGTWKF